jgi:hypothetical protein
MLGLLKSKMTSPDPAEPALHVPAKTELTAFMFQAAQPRPDGASAEIARDIGRACRSV